MIIVLPIYLFCLLVLFWTLLIDHIKLSAALILGTRFPSHNEYAEIVIAPRNGFKIRFCVLNVTKDTNKAFKNGKGVVRRCDEFYGKGLIFCNACYKA